MSDLCPTCSEEEHDTCPLILSCRCCRQTATAMEEDQ